MRRLFPGVRILLAGSIALAASIATAGAVVVAGDAPAGAVLGGTGHRELSGSTIADRADGAIVDVITRTDRGQAAGTGIVITPDGEILTNYHVVEGSTSITVTISNASQSFSAKVVGSDRLDDVALLQARNAHELATIDVGRSSSVKIGDRVVAIGNAFNRPGKPTVTEGMVAALRRSITVFGDFGAAEQLSNLIQTDAQLAPGNSGGPLFNVDGQVIGINTAAETGRRLTVGTGDGYAIPIDDAMKVVRQIRSGRSRGNVHVGPRALLGVNIRDADQQGDARGGVLVVGVTPSGAADAIGIVRGDQIVRLARTDVTSVRALTRVMNLQKPGAKVPIEWIDQAGLRHDGTVRLTASPTP
jgi:S1-C subfamily serine protease